MTIRVLPSRRVICEMQLMLPLTARQAWGQLRDFQRYASHDHFHAGILIEGNVPRGGARLAIEHRYGPFRTRRIGKILRWREGEGFAYSDLSATGISRGFPHVMSMRLFDLSATQCRLTIRVTGRWTAPTPRWLGRIWLSWVMLSIGQRVRNDLLAFAFARSKGRMLSIDQPLVASCKSS